MSQSNCKIPTVSNQHNFPPNSSTNSNGHDRSQRSPSPVPEEINEKDTISQEEESTPKKLNDRIKFFEKLQSPGYSPARAHNSLAYSKSFQYTSRSTDVFSDGHDSTEGGKGVFGTPGRKGPRAASVEGPIGKLASRTANVGRWNSFKKPSDILNPFKDDDDDDEKEKVSNCYRFETRSPFSAKLLVKLIFKR